MNTLLTFEAAASILTISTRQFRRLVDGGHIAYVQIGDRSVRVRQQDLDEYIEKRRKQHPAKAA